MLLPVKSPSQKKVQVHVLNPPADFFRTVLDVFACKRVWSVRISLLIQMRQLGENNIKDRGLQAGSNDFKLKTSWWICLLQTCCFSLHKMLTDRLESCGILVDYCDVFISWLDSHSDGTHSLLRIHWWVRWWNANFLKICSSEETKGRVHF